MGDFEVFLNYISVIILGVIIYNVISCLAFRDLLKRFGFLKLARRDFFECGFKPQTQKPIKISIQFLLIAVFFLIYDIELVFIFPYVSGMVFGSFYDTALITLFFFLFFLSIAVDYEKHALYWQY